MSETTDPISNGEPGTDGASEVSHPPIAAEVSEPSGGGVPPKGVAASPKAAPDPRKILSGVFVVLFSRSLLVTVLSVWSVRQVLEHQRVPRATWKWRSESPAVQTELSDCRRQGSRAGGPAREG